MHKRLMAIMLAFTMALPVMGILPASAEEIQNPSAATIKPLSEKNFEMSEVTRKGHEAAQKAQSYVDQLTFADESSSVAHNVQIEDCAGSSVRSFNTSAHPVGQYIDYVTAMYLAPKEGVVSFDMSVNKGKPLTLEFEEMHNKEFDTFAYYVNVDGTDVYLRAFESTSAGPCHYFVAVPAELTEGKETVHVTLRNVSDAHAYINRVWAWSDFATLVQEEKLSNKMNINLYPTGVPNNLHHSTEELFERYDGFLKAYGNNYDMYDIGFCTEMQYFRLPQEDISELERQLFDYVMDRGIPYSYAYCSYWGGTPMESPDGKGGFFGDLQYQQLVYDPQDILGRGVYQTTTPNMWGNTPWLSFNNDSFNQVRNDRYIQRMKELSELVAKHRLESDDNMPKLSLYLENEPIYWVHASKDATADVAGPVVEDAKKAGVNLNPVDGMSAEEEAFLWQNLNVYISEIMDAAVRGLGNDYILVNDGKVSLPKTQLHDNIFTHMFESNQTKTYLPTVEYDLFETHETLNGHYGAEGWGGDWPRYRGMMDYIIARGKFGAVNIEHGSAFDFNYFLDYYTYGADFLNFYNARLDDDIKPYDNRRDEQVAAPLYGKEIFSHKFDNLDALETDEQLIECKNFSMGVITTQEAATANFEEPGVATFKVDNKEPLSNGLMVQIAGLAQPKVDMGDGTMSNCYAELFAGSSLDSMRLVQRIDKLSMDGYMFDITDFIDKTKPEAYFKVVLHGFPGVPISWACLNRVGAFVPFAADKPGHVNGFAFTREQTRYNNTMISLRADVEKMMAKYVEKNGQDAYYQDVKKLYDCGLYQSTKDLISGITSLTLPAKFMIKGSGQLADFPVAAAIENAEQPVSVKLNAIGDKYDFDVKSDVPTSITLTFAANAEKYILEKKESNKDTIGVNYVLTPNEQGDIAAVDGQVSVTISADDGKKPLPKEFSAFTGSPEYQTDTQFAFISQDNEIGQNAYRVLLPYAEKVSIKRGPLGVSEDKMEELPIDALKLIDMGEQADITLNDEGMVEKLRIYYATVTGRVTKVDAPKFPDTTSEFFELTTTSGEKFKFEIGWKTKMSTAKIPYSDFASVNYAKTNGVGLAKGDTVSVIYMPMKTGDNDYYYATNIYDAGMVTLLDEDFDDEALAKSRIESMEGVSVRVIEPGYTVYGLSTSAPGPGKAVWKLTCDKPIRGLAISYSGRAIFGGTLKISAAGSNGLIYKELASMESSLDHTLFFAADTKSPIITGGNTVYIKVDFQGVNDSTWSYLNSIKVSALTDEITGGTVALPNNIVPLNETVTAVPTLTFEDGLTLSENDYTYIYDIENPEIAEVVNGEIKGKAKGKTPATILVKAGLDIYSLDTEITVQ